MPQSGQWLLVAAQCLFFSDTERERKAPRTPEPRAQLTWALPLRLGYGDYPLVPLPLTATQDPLLWQPALSSLVLIW